MKKLMILPIILCFALSSCNRYHKEANETACIEVTGSAEMEIEPDEIHLEVVVGNFSEKFKNGTGKELLSLDAADKRFMDIIAKVGIDKSKITLKDAATTNYWSYYIRYRQYMENVRLEKRYDVVLNSADQLNSLLSELPGPQDGIVSVNITELKNKDIAEYRKQTKIMAMKAAKEKAKYLLESIGSRVGKPVYVQEIKDNGYDTNIFNPQSNMLMRQEKAMSYDSDAAEQTQMKKIKLRYEIGAKFEIQ